MGEAKQEEAKVETKPEEKKEEKKTEEKKEDRKKKEKTEEKKEEAKPSPPSPIVLSVDLHCVGCAKKIEKIILKCRGVEEVETDMATNQVRVKGIVDPQVLCSRIHKKTLRNAQVLSPLPPPQDSAESTKSQVVVAQVNGLSTVESHVNMHCEACAQQLRKKIMKMRGVQEVETELSTGKVKVIGTMTGDQLVDYIYRRTGKLAELIPPPPPPPPKEEEKKEDAEKKSEEKPAEEKKDEKPTDEKKEENADKKKEEKSPQQSDNVEVDNKDGGGGNEGEKSGGGEEAKREEELVQINNMIMGPEDMVKRMMYWNGGYMGEDEMAKRMMVPWMPVYVIERPPPPPQIFSDENPNACCIS